MIDMPSKQPVGSFLAFAAELSRRKALLQDSLFVMESLLRDVIVYNYYPEKIINHDLKEQVKCLSEKFTVKELVTKIDTVQRADKNIKSGANMLLTLEIMAMRLFGTIRGPVNI
jgi:hypothetical protein